MAGSSTSQHQEVHTDHSEDLGLAGCPRVGGRDNHRGLELASDLITQPMEPSVMPQIGGPANLAGLPSGHGVVLQGLRW